MSKTPDQIWIGLGMPGYISDDPPSDLYNVKYVRADLVDASAMADQIDRLRKQLKDTLNREAETQRRHDAKLDAKDARIAELGAALKYIAKPKPGPEFDWATEEMNRWRASWYRNYEKAARTALKGERNDE